QNNVPLINSEALFVYNLPTYLTDLLRNSFKASDLIGISNGQDRIIVGNYAYAVFTFYGVHDRFIKTCLWFWARHSGTSYIAYLYVAIHNFITSSHVITSIQ